MDSESERVSRVQDEPVRLVAEQLELGIKLMRAGDCLLVRNKVQSVLDLVRSVMEEKRRVMSI